MPASALIPILSPLAINDVENIHHKTILSIIENLLLIILFLLLIDNFYVSK